MNKETNVIKKIIILLFLLITTFQFIHPSPSQKERLLKVPVRVLMETDTGWEYAKDLKADDFELRIDEEKKPIVEFYNKNKSIQGIHQGRCFALSFDVTGYSRPLSGAISHFIHHVLTPSDHLLVRSPVHIYKLDTTAEKKEIITYIETNLKKDILQYKENKTTAINNLNLLIKNLEKKLDSKKIGARSILLFISHYSNQWNNFYPLLPAANLEKYQEIASRMSLEDRKAEKWLIHFQENNRDMASIAEQYQKIGGKIKKYVSSKHKSFGEQAASITHNLDKIEKSMRFSQGGPGQEMLDVLLGVNLNCSAVFFNPQHNTLPGYKKILQDISRQTGGISIDAENLVNALEAIKKHTDFYYELIFKFDGKPEDKNIRVTTRAPLLHDTAKTHVYYKKKFKKDEFNYLLDWLTQAEKEISITGYNLENHRLSFIISGFTRTRAHTQQPGPGHIKVDIRLINDRQETVYETGNTLKAADDSVSISLDLPSELNGYFKLSITAGDLISGKNFELKKYIKL
jgi:hypothetical protein